MDATALLSTLAERGLTASADGDAIRVRPRNRLTDDLRAAILAHRAELLPALPRYRWHVLLADGHEIEVACLPELTAAEVSARYPDANSVKPAPSALPRQATTAEAGELAALVASVYRNDTEDERSEALTVALADPASALICYRVIARARAAVADAEYPKENEA